MIALWTLFSGSKLGQWIIAGVAIAGALLIAVWRIFAAGKKSAQVEVMKDTLDDVAKKNEAEDRVDSATPVEREQLRDKWTRP